MSLPVSRCNQAGARLLLALALMLVTFMALTPTPGAVQQAVNDKLGHTLAFALLALLVHASWPDRKFDWRLGLPLLGYGLAIECFQHFIPNRVFSLLDLLADATGILLYLAVLTLLSSRPRAVWVRHR